MLTPDSPIHRDSFAFQSHEATTHRDPLGLTPLIEDNRQRFLQFVLGRENAALIPLAQILEVIQIALEDIFPVPVMCLAACSASVAGKAKRSG